MRIGSKDMNYFFRNKTSFAGKLSVADKTGIIDMSVKEA